MAEELRTARLLLRRPVEDDIDVILRIHADVRACIHNPSDALATRQEAVALFSRWDAHWERFGFGYWVARRLETSEVVGFCGLKTMRIDGREVLNLFCRLDPSTWGRGFGTEACRAIVAWGTAAHPDHHIVARVRPSNLTSQRLVAAVGLVREADLDRDGEDGLDWIYVSRPWTGRSCLTSVDRSREPTGPSEQQSD